MPDRFPNDNYPKRNSQNSLTPTKLLMFSLFRQIQFSKTLCPRVPRNFLEILARAISWITTKFNYPLDFTGLRGALERDAGFRNIYSCPIVSDQCFLTAKRGTRNLGDWPTFFVGRWINGVHERRPGQRFAGNHVKLCNGLCAFSSTRTSRGRCFRC